MSDKAEVSPTVKLAPRLQAITAQRPGMIRWLRWDELHHLDFSKRTGGFWVSNADKLPFVQVDQDVGFAPFSDAPAGFVGTRERTFVQLSS